MSLLSTSYYTVSHVLTHLYRRRREYREKGKQLLKDGRRSEAVDCFQKCVDVSPDMALALIKVVLVLYTSTLTTPSHTGMS